MYFSRLSGRHRDRAAPALFVRRTQPVVDLLGHHGVPFKPFSQGPGPNFVRVRKLLYDFTVRYETTAVTYEAPKVRSSSPESHTSDIAWRGLRFLSNCGWLKSRQQL